VPTVVCGPVVEDAELVERLRAGDEGAFVTLVDRYHESLVRLATTFVPSPAVAEEVVQETWLGVVRGIERFEGRSSLKTWLYRILVNRARTAGVRERRTVPTDVVEGPTVDPARFDGTGAWSDPPEAWAERAEERLDAEDLAARVRDLIDGLPENQRQVVVLRDVEGASARDACALLDLSEANQRVLLHRGRARLRRMLELEMGKG
jgi:RNA polymerase sigma-70 factor, ECF subfamily